MRDDVAITIEVEILRVLNGGDTFRAEVLDRGVRRPLQPIDNSFWISIAGDYHRTAHAPRRASRPAPKAVAGVVVLRATVGKTGTVENIETVSGPAKLVPAAVQAVRQLSYPPEVFKGDAQKATREVIVNFRLSER